MKTTVAIDVMYTKYIEVETPSVKMSEDAEIIEKAVEDELRALPENVNGFFYNWVNYEEV